MRWLSLASILLLPAAAFGDAQVEFSRALRQERAGDVTGALRVLTDLGRGDDRLADDALMQAGRILEEKLGRPAEALARYREVVDRFPRSRLARRATARASFLESNLSTGEAPLIEFQKITSGNGGRDLGSSIARMERLLARQRSFPASDRALLWLGGAYRRDGRTGKALDAYQQVVRRFADRRTATRALEEIGDTYLAIGQLALAEETFRKLEARSEARAAARNGLRRVEVARGKQLATRGAWGAAAFLVGALIVLAMRRAGRAILRPGTELALAAPLFLFLLGLALLERWRATGATSGTAPSSWQFGAAAQAIAIMAVGGLILSQVGSVLSDSRRPSRWLAYALPPGLALAALAVCVLALDATGLASFVLETLRSGAE